MSDQKSEIERFEEFLLERHTEIMELYHRQQRGEANDQPLVKFYGKENVGTQTSFPLDNLPEITEVERDLFELDAIHGKLKLILQDLKDTTNLIAYDNSKHVKQELRDALHSTFEIFLRLTTKPADEYKSELGLCVKISVLCEKIAIVLNGDSITDLLVNQVFQKSLSIQLHHVDNFSNKAVLKQALQFNDECYRRTRSLFVRNLLVNSPDTVADSLSMVNKSAIKKLVELTEVLDSLPDLNTASVQSVGTQLSASSESIITNAENYQVISQAEIQSSLNEIESYIAANNNLSFKQRTRMSEQISNLLTAMGKHLYQKIRQNSKLKTLKLESDIFRAFNLAIALDTTFIKYLEKYTNDYYKLYRAYQHLANLYQKYNRFYQKSPANPEAKHWIKQYSLFIQDRALNLRSIIICEKAVKSYALTASQKKLVKAKAREYLQELSTTKLFEEFCGSDFATNFDGEDVDSANLTTNDLLSLYNMHVLTGQSMDIQSSTITLDKYYQNVTSYLMQTLSSLFGDELVEEYFVLFIASDIQFIESRADINSELSANLQVILANTEKAKILKDALQLFYDVQAHYYREAILPSIADDNTREKEFTNTLLFTSNLRKEIFQFLLSTIAQQDIDLALQSCEQIIKMRMYVNSFIKVLTNLKIQELQQFKADLPAEVKCEKVSQPTLVESVTNRYLLENTDVSLPNWHDCQREVAYLINSKQYAHATQTLAEWLAECMQTYDSAVYTPSLFAAHMQQVYIYKLENDYAKALEILENIDIFIAPKGYGLLNVQQLYTKYAEMASLHKLFSGAASEQAALYYAQANELAKHAGFISFATLYGNYTNTLSVDSELVDFLFAIEVENGHVKNFNVLKYDLEYFFKFYNKFAGDIFKQALHSKAVDSADDDIIIGLKIYKKLASISRCYPKYIVKNLLALAEAYHNLQEVNPSTLNLKKTLEAYYEVVKHAKKHANLEISQQAWHAIGTLKEKYGLQYMQNKKKPTEIDDLSPELQEELYQELFKAIVTALDLTTEVYDSELSDVKNYILALQVINIYLLCRQDDSKLQVLQAVKNDLYTKIVTAYNEKQHKFKALYLHALKDPKLNSNKELISWCEFEQAFATFSIKMQDELEDEKEQLLTSPDYESDSLATLNNATQKLAQLKKMLISKKVELPAELASDPEDIISGCCLFAGLAFSDEFLEKYSSAADAEDNLYQSSIVLLQVQKYWQGIGLAYTVMPDKRKDSVQANMLGYIIAKTLHWAAKSAASQSFIELFADKSLALEILNLLKNSARQQFSSLSHLDSEIMLDIQRSRSQLSFIGEDNYSPLRLYNSANTVGYKMPETMGESLTYSSKVL